MVFRRREPLHVRLAREGGLAPAPGPQPHDPGPHWGEVGIHGVHRQRQWDALVTTDADVAGVAVRFVTLADGTLVIESGEVDADPTPLAEALEASLAPPYRAEAVRQGRVWAVGARTIEVVELDPDPAGDELELSWNGREMTLLVDGAPAFGAVPALERLAGTRHEQWAARAERLDGSLWEVSVSPL